jgi:hypothetical protein
MPSGCETAEPGIGEQIRSRIAASAHAGLSSTRRHVMQQFVHDDPGYLLWLAQNPGGYVINTYSRPSALYLRLHRATCGSISRLQLNARTFTDGEYSKLCGARTELEHHAQRLGGTALPCTNCI